VLHEASLRSCTFLPVRRSWFLGFKPIGERILFPPQRSEDHGWPVAGSRDASGSEPSNPIGERILFPPQRSEDHGWPVAGSRDFIYGIPAAAASNSSNAIG